jgi:hypothetical protein
MSMTWHATISNFVDEWDPMKSDKSINDQELNTPSVNKRWGWSFRVESINGDVLFDISKARQQDKK